MVLVLSVIPLSDDGKLKYFQTTDLYDAGALMILGFSAMLTFVLNWFQPEVRDRDPVGNSKCRNNVVPEPNRNPDQAAEAYRKWNTNKIPRILETFSESLLPY